MREKEMIESLEKLFCTMNENQLEYWEDFIYNRRKELEAQREEQACEYANQLATLIHEIQEAGFKIHLYIDEDETKIYHDDNLGVSVVD